VLRFFEVALVLVRFDHVASVIVNPDYRIRVRPYPLHGRLATIRLELLICEWALPSLVPAY